eukprot:2123207-Karenia_brevis.AAC.1
MAIHGSVSGNSFPQIALALGVLTWLLTELTSVPQDCFLVPARMVPSALLAPHKDLPLWSLAPLTPGVNAPNVWAHPT